MSAVESFSVPVETADSNAMYLRMEVASAVLDDGRKAELALSGSTLILTVGEFEGNDASGRTVQTVTIRAFMTAWLTAFEAAGL